MLAVRTSSGVSLLSNLDTVAVLPSCYFSCTNWLYCYAPRTSSGVSLLRLKCCARPGKYCSTPAGVEMFRSGLTFLNLTDTAAAVGQLGQLTMMHR